MDATAPLETSRPEKAPVPIEAKPDITAATQKAKHLDVEHARAAGALFRPGELTQSILDHMVGSICVLDLAGVILAVNRGWVEFSLDNGLLTPHHAAGANYLDVCKRDRSAIGQKITTGLSNVLAGEQSIFVCSYPCHSPTERRWYEMRVHRLDTGNETFVVIVHYPITSLKKSEQRLRQSNRSLKTMAEAARAATLAKGEFLANMSHEIRTPLNAVLGMAQSLDGDNLSPAQKQKVATILESGKLLTTLLNDVLDTSKIEAGKLEIVPITGDLLQTVARAQRLFQARAEEKGLKLRISPSSRLPPRLAFDPVRVEQCLNNLLSNAIKFTAEGHVAIACATTRQADGSHLVTIEVSDTGIGIGQSAQAKLFSVFTQADGAITRTFGGTGLGLSISRQLARLMGGDLVLVHSEEGTGSAFLLTFTAIEVDPIQHIAVEETRRSTPAIQNLRGRRILLVDDNAINRQVIKLFLAPLGCQITEVVNGREALDKLGTEPFDLVLLDVHMPVMDGKEAIKRIRASTEIWRAIPTIALTADAMLGDRETLLALGMTDYLPKPIDQRLLVSKILDQLDGPASETDRIVATG